MTDETTQYGATTEPNDVDGRLDRLETGLQDEIGDAADIYRDGGDEPYLAVETDAVSAELRVDDDGVDVSYALSSDPSGTDAAVVEAVQDAVLPETYDAGQSDEEYGPVEVESPGWTW